MDVLLHNAGPSPTRRRVFYDVPDFIEVFSDLDTMAPVRVLSRFDDPDVLGRPLGLVVLLL